MFDADEEPRKKQALRNLDTLSIAELNEYIGQLQAEIVRVEAERMKKEAHANAASSLFGLKTNG